MIVLWKNDQCPHDLDSLEDLWHCLTIITQISLVFLQTDDEDSPASCQVLPSSVLGNTSDISLVSLLIHTLVSTSCWLWLFTLKHCSLLPDITEFWYSSNGCSFNFIPCLDFYLHSYFKEFIPSLSLCINLIAPILCCFFDLIDFFLEPFYVYRTIDQKVKRVPLYSSSPHSFPYY